MNIQSTCLSVALLLCLTLPKASGQQTASSTPRYSTETNILYRMEGETDNYMRERCRLDIYHPDGRKDFPTVVWFHGGGLTGGNRFVPAGLKEQGIAVVAANYRLSPVAKAPAWIQDAAAAVAWTFRNVENFGGSTNRIFVSGHSAEGLPDHHDWAG